MITAADESFHPHSDDPYWNESSYFSFNIPERELNGYVYFYTRPNMKYTVGGVCVWDPSGRHVFDCRHHDWGTPYALPPGADMYDFSLPNGLTVSCPQPLEEYHLQYRNPDCSLDLRWTALLDAHEHGLPGGTEDWGHHHYDQGGRITGTLTLDGEELAVDCGSFRDHSWGPRHPGKANPRAGVTIAIGTAENSFTLWSIAEQPPATDPVDGAADRVALGWYARDGVTASLVAGQRRVVERHPDSRPKRILVTATDDQGRELEAEGNCRNWLIWHGYPEIYMNWTGTVWTFDGVQVWGEEQDFWPFSQGRKYVRNAAANH